MVSNARDDLPEPDRPVITVRLSRGMSTAMPLRLCSRAPRTLMWVSIRFRSASEYGSAFGLLRSSFVLISVTDHVRSTSLQQYGVGGAHRNRSTPATPW